LALNWGRVVVKVTSQEGDLVVTVEKAGWPQGLSAQAWKICLSPEFDAWAVQPVAIH